MADTRDSRRNLFEDESYCIVEEDNDSAVDNSSAQPYATSS